MHYERVVLKLSGEAFASPETNYGIDPHTVERVASEIAEAHEKGVQIAIVVGGGNIFRGVAAATQGMDRANADYMGMLATVINAMALRDGLERAGVEARLQTAIEMQAVAEPYIRLRAIRHLEKGRVVIFAAGTGNPFFTTDTAAALRAAEIEAGAVLKATKVDGVFSADPATHPEATKLEEVSYMDVISGGLAVMDTTAITLCMENKLEVVVFSMLEPGNIARALSGAPTGTRIR